MTLLFAAVQHYYHLWAFLFLSARIIAMTVFMGAFLGQHTSQQCQESVQRGGDNFNILELNVGKQKLKLKEVNLIDLNFT